MLVSLKTDTAYFMATDLFAPPSKKEYTQELFVRD